MRVLQLIDTLGVGGAEKLLVTFSRTAARFDVQTTVAYLSEPDTPLLLDELGQTGVRTVNFTAPRLFHLRRLRDLTAFLRRERFDLIHTHLTYANILGNLAGKLSNTPVVSSLHNTAVDPVHANPIRDRLELLALRYWAARVVAVAGQIAVLYRPLLGGRAIDVALNAVTPFALIDEGERELVRAELGLTPDQVLLIAVGRLSAQKAYPDLLAAFVQVRRTCPQAVLLIVGDGALREMIENRIRELDLSGNVVLAGVRPDVPRLLQAADVFVMSSHFEGLPIAVLEAMTAGLPLVATAVGEIPAIAPPEAALLVAPRQPEQLAAAILTLAQDPARRKAAGAAARRIALERFSPETWVRRLAQVYTAARSGIRSGLLVDPEGVL